MNDVKGTSKPGGPGFIRLAVVDGKPVDGASDSGALVAVNPGPYRADGVSAAKADPSIVTKSPIVILAEKLEEFFVTPGSSGNQSLRDKIFEETWAEHDTKGTNPVYQPSFENLKTVKFEAVGNNELRVTLSPEHVKQGYLQILSDLTLVEKYIKNFIRENDEKADKGKLKFNADSLFESIKIISHPERNKALSDFELGGGKPYNPGPVFKFVKPNGLRAYPDYIPVLVGMPFVQELEPMYSTPQGTQNHLEKLAFDPSKENPTSHLFSVLKPMLTAANRWMLADLSNSANTKALYNILDRFGYRRSYESLTEDLRGHGGLVFHGHRLEMGPDDALLPPTHQGDSFESSLREIANYDIPGENRRRVTNLTALNQPSVQSLLRVDGLNFLVDGRNHLGPDDRVLLPRYALLKK